ncbi:hypothetical protein XFLAVUS301_25500 [Xanthobacter flavus]|uniref:Uncharacterized protein n=1 Tax=Xanthobacter flavus TaxID=281 RepID=A0A9W6FK25_XANFL|nr:hypothetical protein XFLAVUS301_25500 [Xanthobacter flavus]
MRLPGTAHFRKRGRPPPPDGALKRKRCSDGLARAPKAGENSPMPRPDPNARFGWTTCPE